MADRVGPVPGGRGRYDYGVPNDDDSPFAPPDRNGRDGRAGYTYGDGNGADGSYGNGSYGTNGSGTYANGNYGAGDYGTNGNGNGNGNGSGNGSRYDYTEPFEYTGRVSSGTVTARGPSRARVNEPTPFGSSQHLTAETMPLGVITSATLAGRETRDERLGIPSGPSGGRAERRRAAKRAKRRRRLSITKEIPILIGVALFIALVLKTFLVQAFVIPSGSMEQTIRIGDRVLVDKLTPWFGSKPERGDVVVFKDPGGWLPASEKRQEDAIFVKQGKWLMTSIGLLPSDSEQDLIKRVVGVGGDKVKCCNKQGKLTVNGKAVDEPYLYPGNKPSTINFEVTVPIGRVFVMGDHRSNSADSRFHLRDEGKGTVPEDLVVGRAAVIAWPFNHWTKLEDAGAYSSVPDAKGAASAAPAIGDSQVMHFPIPVELPLVMGVVGLSRLSGGRQWIVRSDCGGLGGRRSFRFRRGRGRERSG